MFAATVSPPAPSQPQAEKQLKEAWRNAKPEKKVEMCAARQKLQSMARMQLILLDVLDFSHFSPQRWWVGCQRNVDWDDPECLILLIGAD